MTKFSIEMGLNHTVCVCCEREQQWKIDFSIPLLCFFFFILRFICCFVYCARIWWAGVHSVHQPDDVCATAPFSHNRSMYKLSRTHVRDLDSVWWFLFFHRKCARLIKFTGLYFVFACLHHTHKHTQITIHESRWNKHSEWLNFLLHGFSRKIY